MNDTRKQVIDLLKAYPEMLRQITLLRYELEHPTNISADEMISAMSFAKHDGEGGRPAGVVSNKTLYIVMNYQQAMTKLDEERSGELAKELFELEGRVKKLEYYMSILTEQERESIRLYFFEKRTLQQISDALKISHWAVRKCRDSGVDSLVKMYDFMDEMNA